MSGRFQRVYFSLTIFSIGSASQGDSPKGSNLAQSYVAIVEKHAFNLNLVRCMYWHMAFGSFSIASLPLFRLRGEFQFPTDILAGSGGHRMSAASSI